MTIDRKTFLVLTASIAACAGGEPPPAAPLDIPIGAMKPSDPPPPPSSPPAPPATTVSMVTTPSSESYASTEGGPASESYAASEGSGTYAACGVSSRKFDASRVGCDDSTGAGAAAPSCSQMKRPASSCGAFPFPKQECESWRTNFKPKVADAAIACADKLTSAQVCDACNTYRCANDALKGACPDKAAVADCKKLGMICAGVDQSECVALMSGMTATGRAKMATCMKGQSCPGVYSCSESL